MNAQQQRRGAAGLAPFDLSSGSAFRRLDAPDGPARALSDKRAAIAVRRKRKALKRTCGHKHAVDQAAADGAVVSNDATLSFSIVRICKGILVKRTHCPPIGPHIVQMMRFDSIERFDSWCDEEPVQFGDPLLHGQLRRYGHELL